MATMTQAPVDESASAAHRALFSDPETVKAVVVPDVDPAAVVAVFSSTY